MNIFLYDKTFEGLLTSVFEAYSRRIFPDALLLEGEPLPLFYDEIFTVITDEEKSGRVWRGLQKKLSSAALACLAQCWLAEEPETPMLLFRYIRKAIDAPRSIETNFADPDVLEFSRMWKRVDGSVYACFSLSASRRLRTVLSLLPSSPKRMPFLW